LRRGARVLGVVRRLFLGTALIAAGAAAGGCGWGASGRIVLNVYAASSLTDAFRDLEPAFEAAHPDVDVALTFAGSQVLRVQIEQGARADVFASANPEHMQALADAGTVRHPRLFAHNELVVIVPVTNPADIESFEDLPKARRIVLGTENVPVGRYAREALGLAEERFGFGFADSVMAHVVSQETNVRLARAKVELGEADAAIVYLTDATGSDRLRLIQIPPAVNVQADYLIGVLTGSEQAALADAWTDLVLSAEGRERLVSHGFTVE
jgi:molybdate transport system substrate-binding protein